MSARLLMATSAVVMGTVGVAASFLPQEILQHADLCLRIRKGCLSLRLSWNTICKDLASSSRQEWHFTPEDAPFSPYIGGGASYIFLDTTEGQIDDEVGWYAVAGGDFGHLSSGLSFNAEAIYRSVDATVQENHHGLPSDVTDKAHIDLSGLGANVGVVWRF